MINLKKSEHILKHLLFRITILSLNPVVLIKQFFVLTKTEPKVWSILNRKLMGQVILWALALLTTIFTSEPISPQMLIALCIVTGFIAVFIAACETTVFFNKNGNTQ